MKRRSFLAMLGLAPIAGVVAAKGATPDASGKVAPPLIYDGGVFRMDAANFGTFAGGTMSWNV